MDNQGKRILVVEDSREYRDLLGILLSTHGYEFDSAKDGIEALEKLRAGAFDLVISDVLMPRMDGFQLCREVKSDEELKTIPLIFYTGQYTHADDEELAKSLCAALYLHKPMEKDKLLENIRQVLERSDAGEISAPARILDEKDFTTAHSERMAIKLTHKIEELDRERCNLQESEERHQTILNTAMDGFCLTDTQGRILEVNETYCRMSGYSEEELLTMRIPDMEAVEAAADVADHIKNIMAQGEVRFESRHRRKDGTIFDVEISVQYRPVQGGRFVAFLRDVTERKQAEEALIEAHKNLERKVQERTRELEKTNTALQSVAAYNRSLFESNIDPFVTINLEGKLTDANNAVETVTGFSRDELIGTDWTDYFTDPDGAQAGFQNVFSQGELRDYELQLRHRNGKITPVLCTASLYRDESGKVIGVIGVARDITARKTSERALRESEQRYRIVADNTYDWEFWLSPQHDVFYTSPSCERITGYLPQEFQQNKQLILDIVHPDDFPGFEQHHYAEFKRDYSGLREMKFRIIRKDGSVRWIGHLCGPVFSESGKFMGTRGSNRDITEHKQAEDELRKSETRLIEAQHIAHIGNWELDLQSNNLKWS
ncbi:MAG: PAS domain S-box protein, partial [Syntrophales bacterium]